MAGATFWGWHRLEARWAARLVADAHIAPGRLVIDIGAGDGAITAALIESGARVIAVELHPERAAHLRRRFGPEVTVVEADATDLYLPRRPFHVVANPPFAVSTAVLRRLLQPGSRLVSATMVLPAPVVRRWCSPTAPAAARWQRSFVAVPGRCVPVTAFRPPAPVPVRVLHIVRRGP